MVTTTRVATMDTTRVKVARVSFCGQRCVPLLWLRQPNLTLSLFQYVDLDYQGGGIGEYKYWDRDKRAWDQTACDYTGSSRCAKMDCHVDNTHFSLLGFFKHKSYDEWMGQLFKHEGSCVWSQSEYNFMSNAREAWPTGCKASGYSSSDGKAIYYDTKPIQGGSITI